MSEIFSHLDREKRYLMEGIKIDFKGNIDLLYKSGITKITETDPTITEIEDKDKKDAIAAKEKMLVSTVEYPHFDQESRSLLAPESQEPQPKIQVTNLGEWQNL